MTGAVHKCTTKAFFVSDQQHDLLGGRALVTAKYRVILDKDPKVSGIFPVRNGEIDQLEATGLPFLDSEGLFFLKLYRYLKNTIQRYVRISPGHRRLGHCLMQTIRDTIPYAKGIEELSNESFDQIQQ